jgi:hypothetical protein
VIPMTLDNVTQSKLQMYENNYKSLNLINTALCMSIYDRIAHLKTVNDIWLKLYNSYEALLLKMKQEKSNVQGSGKMYAASSPLQAEQGMIAIELEIDCLNLKNTLTLG